MLTLTALLQLISFDALHIIIVLATTTSSSEQYDVVEPLFEYCMTVLSILNILIIYHLYIYITTK